MTWKAVLGGVASVAAVLGFAVGMAVLAMYAGVGP